jgi:hypothetical protein
MFFNAHQQIGLGGAEVKIVAQSQADDARFGMTMLRVREFRR